MVNEELKERIEFEKEKAIAKQGLVIRNTARPASNLIKTISSSNMKKNAKTYSKVNQQSSKDNQINSSINAKEQTPNKSTTPNDGQHDSSSNRKESSNEQSINQNEKTVPT